jgi:uncharacterized protein YbaR (Trm112 family)
MLPADLIEVLVCPRSKQPLIYFPRGEHDRDEAEAFLLCPSSRLRYRIDNDLPILLVSEASEVSADEAKRLVARAHALGLPVRP